MVNSITDETLTDGYIGFHVGDLQEVAFDNLEVRVTEDGLPLLKQSQVLPSMSMLSVHPAVERI